MPFSSPSNKVLVLLIGEVLKDPRVYKTCMSLQDAGAEVTVACTNPYKRPEQENHKGLSIFRFPHRKYYFLKRTYNWIKDRIHPNLGNKLSRVHEEIPESSLRAFLRNFVLGLNHRHFMKSNLKINRLMIQAFAGRKFDLVHCNDVDTLIAGSELRKTGVARELLYDSHEYWPGIGVHGSGTNTVLHEAEAQGIRNADYVVTVNSMIAGLLREIYNLDTTPSVVMNCPYLYEGELHLDEIHSPVRIIYQGKIQAFRGLPELVCAFKYIENGTLTFSGYGPLEESLKLLAASEGLADRVTFIGRYEPHDAVKILTDYDIGVLPFKGVTLNITYCSPNKLFDYAAAGLAVAASNLPLLAKTIWDYEIGVLFDAIDPQAIANTLNNMISDTHRLGSFKKNAHAAAFASFFWQKQFENYPWKS